MNNRSYLHFIACIFFVLLLAASQDLSDLSKDQKQRQKAKEERKQDLLKKQSKLNQFQKGLMQRFSLKIEDVYENITTSQHRIQELEGIKCPICPKPIECPKCPEPIDCDDESIQTLTDQNKALNKDLEKSRSELAEANKKIEDLETSHAQKIEKLNEDCNTKTTALSNENSKLKDGLFRLKDIMQKLKQDNNLLKQLVM